VSEARHTQRYIFLFWAPLALTWLMMAVEGPLLAAIIARLPAEKINLAAYGVAFAFAILVESPVIMLMSASTALVEDATSYRRLRNFAHGLNILSTGLLLVLLAPWVYGPLMTGLIGLPQEVADLTYVALWILLPWPAAIGVRRFLQGILIRSDRTGLVAWGTMIRLAAMATTAFTLYWTSDLPGALVGATALSVGVVMEAMAAWWMARKSVAALRTVRAEPAHQGAAMSYRGIAGFYYPLALTSLIGLTIQPMLTFFMGRAPSPLESLAVFPVVHSLSFIFRALGLSFQEVGIALMGKDHEHFPELRRFSFTLAVLVAGGLGLVAFTPLVNVWFEVVSGLTPELAAFAITPTRIIVIFPALTVLISLERAILVTGKRTGPITWATAVEVLLIAALFPVFGWGVGMIGVTAAFLAVVVGRLGSTAFLAVPSRRMLSRSRARAPHPRDP